MEKTVEVVIGIVVRGGRVLICRRPDDAVLGGYWEFPGGKLEPGESLRACVMRELQEELAIDVEPADALAPIEYEYAHARVRLHPFLCALKRGEPTPIGCQSLQWVEPRGLKDFSFPPANDALIAHLIQRLSDE